MMLLETWEVYDLEDGALAEARVSAEEGVKQTEDSALAVKAAALLLVIEREQDERASAEAFLSGALHQQHHAQSSPALLSTPSTGSPPPLLPRSASAVPTSPTREAETPRPHSSSPSFERDWFKGGQSNQTKEAARPTFLKQSTQNWDVGVVYTSYMEKNALNTNSVRRTRVKKSERSQGGKGATQRHPHPHPHPHPQTDAKPLRKPRPVAQRVVTTTPTPTPTPHPGCSYLPILCSCVSAWLCGERWQKEKEVVDCSGCAAVVLAGLVVCAIERGVRVVRVEAAAVSAALCAVVEVQRQRRESVVCCVVVAGVAVLKVGGLRAVVLRAEQGMRVLQESEAAQREQVLYDESDLRGEMFLRPVADVSSVCVPSQQPKRKTKSCACDVQGMLAKYPTFHSLWTSYDKHAAPQSKVMDEKAVIEDGARDCVCNFIFYSYQMVNHEMDVGLHGWVTTPVQPVIPRYTITRALYFNSTFFRNDTGRKAFL